MRPHFTQRWIKSRSVSSTCFATYSIVALAAGGLAFVFASQTIACMFSPPPDKSAEIKLALAPGVEAAIQVSLFETKDEENPESTSSCYASAYLPLSAFPSTSNRYGTHDIAAAVREQIDTWELTECSITLYFENDTEVELAEYELCVEGSFAFEKGSVWSTDGESYCWDPVEYENFQNLTAEIEAAADAEEAALAEEEWQAEEASEVDADLAMIDSGALGFE